MRFGSIVACPPSGLYTGHLPRRAHGSTDTAMDCFRRPAVRVPGLLLGGLLGLQAGTAHALDPSRRITQYGLDVWLTRDGLPQNSVRALVQTRDGYLWLGTWGGLARFDGVRFAVFSGANTPALRDSRITALLEDADGSLWIGTAAAGDIWIAARGGLTRVHGGRVTTFGQAQGFPADAALSICADRDGNLWIGTSGGGLVRMRGERFDALTARDGLSNDVIPALFEDAEGSLWIGSNDGLNQLRDTRFTVVTAREGLTADAVTSVLPAADGSLWIGTDGGGLNRLRDGQIAAFTTANGLVSNYTGALFVASDGSVWTTGDGVVTRLARGKLRVYSAADG